MEELPTRPTPVLGGRAPAGVGDPVVTVPVVSVIVPTYRERENLPELIERVGALREGGLNLELLLMDDDSRDGSAQFIAALGAPWVRLITRTSNRGLSPAVIEGFHAARGERLVVMDADLSHPPEKIGVLLAALDDGAEMAIGSRYVPGGQTDAGWSLARAINSRVATLMARPFTNLKDPMAGFFAIRRSTALGGAPLSPVGYKIGLELIVKCGLRRVVETPISFRDRTRGESKLSLREQLRYVEHLRRLAVFKLTGGAKVVVRGAAGPGQASGAQSGRAGGPA